MNISILTTFPEMFDSVLNASVLGRARQNGLIDVQAVDIRPFSASKHKNTDDYPFGGGAGMLMMAQPIADCIRAVQAQKKGTVIYMSPRGEKLTQRLAERLAQEEHLILLCGHYEGVDQRVLDGYVDMEVSVGDYVLTGGETAAIVLVDCVSRLIPGVLGSAESAQDESFSTAGLLEYPQYTRPRVFEGTAVPQVLLDGDHAKINAWRRQQALLTTARRRPDMLVSAPMTDRERHWLREQLEQDDPD
ncbi:MAG: tRNA (guanosine(37)-N1)-methyltransferase TrmD [Clostridiales bacterium]|nr:tRNA (guanosine(37)-N1)-methyltransferase TrmD [Clostridiales bacterium]